MSNTIQQNDLSGYTYRQLEQQSYRIQAEIDKEKETPPKTAAKKLRITLNGVDIGLATKLAKLNVELAEINALKEAKLKEAVEAFQSAPKEIKEIASLNQLLPVPKAAAAALKILALDMDDTILGNDSILGSTEWFHWVEAQNSSRNFSGTLHRNLYAYIAEKCPKRCIETDQIVNQVIEEYKKEGWRVIILTARNSRHLQVTLNNLNECNIRLNSEEIVFTEKQDKMPYLYSWLKKIPEYTPETPIHIQFADDNPAYCENVNQLNALDGITANCHRFSTAIASWPWTQNQMENFVFQFLAISQRNPIPKMVSDISESTLEAAKLALKIKELSIETLYLLSSGQQQTDQPGD